MADDQTHDQTGITRDSTGTIADQGSSQSTSQDSTPPNDQSQTSLLNQKAPEAEKPADGTDGADKDAPKGEGAPATYADFKLPEGFTLDAEVKTEADKLFKGMNLTQVQAQELVDFYTKHTTEAFNAPFDAYREMRDGWRRDAENHPDLRGKLAPGKEISVRIGKLLDGLGDAQLSQDFRNLMDLTGAGDHPAFIRVLDKFAQRLTEGTHVAGGGPSEAGQSRPGSESKSAAQAMYPNLPSINR